MEISCGIGWQNGSCYYAAKFNYGLVVSYVDKLNNVSGKFYVKRFLVAGQKSIANSCR